MTLKRSLFVCRSTSDGITCHSSQAFIINIDVPSDPSQHFKLAMRISHQLASFLVMAVWAARTFAFSIGKRIAVRPISYRKVFMSTPSAPNTSKATIRGIEFVQDAVVNVLNDVFDPAEVARNNALAKLEKPKKQKKNKEVQPTLDDAETPEMSEEEKQAIAEAAAASAKRFATKDAMVTAATKMEFGDYQVNAAMGLAKSVGLTPR